MAVSVVNSYAAASDSVAVILESNVDLPTDGKPTRPTRASPALLTSNPAAGSGVSGAAQAGCQRGRNAAADCDELAGGGWGCGTPYPPGCHRRRPLKPP
jgi:hypothetical protein